jgi:hypothetical protein
LPRRAFLLDRGTLDLVVGLVASSSHHDVGERGVPIQRALGDLSTAPYVGRLSESRAGIAASSRSLTGE